MSHKLWKELIVVWIAALSLLLVTWLFLPGDILAGDRGTLFSPVQLTGHEAKANLPYTTLVDTHSIITPTSYFILYSRADNTSWLKDDTGDNQILPGVRPRLSPDGRYIVYRRGEVYEGDIYVYDLQTSVDTLVFLNDDYVVNYSWTPDGSQIVYDYRCRIYVMDRDGSNNQVLIDTWPGSRYCYNDSPHVNPTDGRITWENEFFGIAVADADGQNPYWIPNTQDLDYSPIWSPDGLWIAFWRDDNIYKIHPDGSDLTQLTFLADPDWMENTGAWTVDGSWMVAPAKVDGVMRLYVVAMDGSGRMLPVSTQAGEDPDYVGSAGSAGIHRIFLPLVLRE